MISLFFQYPNGEMHFVWKFPRMHEGKSFYAHGFQEWADYHIGENDSFREYPSA